MEGWASLPPKSGVRQPSAGSFSPQPDTKMYPSWKQTMVARRVGRWCRRVLRRCGTWWGGVVVCVCGGGEEQPGPINGNILDPVGIGINKESATKVCVVLLFCGSETRPTLSRVSFIHGNRTGPFREKKKRVSDSHYHLPSQDDATSRALKMFPDLPD